MEHHPNFWNTTPSRILGQLFGTPPQRLENHPTGATTRTPTGQGRSSGATFWNTTPSSRRATNQTARYTIYGEGSGATFGIPSHRAAGSDRECGDSGPLFDDGWNSSKNVDKSIGTPLRARPLTPSSVFHSPLCKLGVLAQNMLGSAPPSSSLSSVFPSLLCKPGTKHVWARSTQQ